MGIFIAQSANTGFKMLVFHALSHLYRSYHVGQPKSMTTPKRKYRTCPCCFKAFEIDQNRARTIDQNWFQGPIPPRLCLHPAITSLRPVVMSAQREYRLC